VRWGDKTKYFIDNISVMTEYSAFPFVFFFLAEYGSIVFLSTLSSIIFLGGYLVPGVESNGLISGLSLGFKASIILFIIIWIRAFKMAQNV